MAFAIMAVLCMLCILCSVLFMLEAPPELEIKGKKPMALRIFPWDSLSGNFYTPAVPEAGKVNPFQYVLVNRIKPVLKMEEQAKKEEKNDQEKTEIEIANPATPVQPPSNPQEKLDVMITITFKGIYVNLRGDVVALISIVQNSTDKEETLMCKAGTVLLDKIRLEKVGEDSATFSTKTGQVQIDWMKSHQFCFPQ